MKKVYKYATGEPIPEGAVYLNTVAQTKVDVLPHRDDLDDLDDFRDCWLVWPYFLVEVPD